MDWAQAVTIVSAMGLFTGLQAFWIARALDRVEARMDRLEARMDRLEGRMDRVESRLHDVAERLARLEGARAT